MTGCIVLRPAELVAEIEEEGRVVVVPVAPSGAFRCKAGRILHEEWRAAAEIEMQVECRREDRRRICDMGAQLGLQPSDAFGLAVHQQDGAAHRQPVGHPSPQLAAVGMGGVGLEVANAGAHFDFFALDTNGGSARKKQVAERSRRLIADQQHRGVVPPEIVLEVMADPAGIAHTARRHDDGARADLIKLLARLDVFNEAEILPPEGLPYCGRLTELFGMLAEDLSRANCEG